MSTLKSNNEDMTINADGASSEVKFQANGVEKASISAAGAFTSTTIDATALTGNLPAIDGSSLTGVGKVLQVVSSTSTTQVNTSSSSFVTTSHSRSITPSSTSSKILLQTSGNIYNSSSGGFAVVTMYRKIGGGAAANMFSGTWGYTMSYSASGGDHANSQALVYLDSPATTSECVYTVYLRTHAAGTAYYNVNSGTATITLMEIGA